MTEIEQKEIRINTKVFITLIVQIIVTVAMGVSFYFQLRSDIRDIITTYNLKTQYWEEKFNSIELQNSIYRKQNEGFQIQLDQLRNNENQKK